MVVGEGPTQVIDRSRLIGGPGDKTIEIQLGDLRTLPGHDTAADTVRLDRVGADGFPINRAAAAQDSEPDPLSDVPPLGTDVEARKLHLWWRAAFLNRLAWAFAALIKRGAVVNNPGHPHHGIGYTCEVLKNMCQLRLEFGDDGMVSAINLAFAHPSPIFRNVADRFMWAMGATDVTEDESAVEGGLVLHATL